MPTEEKAEKKAVLLRFLPKIHLQLLKVASEESVKRGKQVTVPLLCLEIIHAWLDARKK